MSDRLSGEACLAALTKAETTVKVGHQWIVKLQHQLGHADIGGFLQDAGQIELTVIAHITNGEPVNAHPARRRIHDSVSVKAATLNDGCHGQGFHYRTRLEDINNGLIT